MEKVKRKISKFTYFIIISVAIYEIFMLYNTLNFTGNFKDIFENWILRPDFMLTNKISVFVFLTIRLIILLFVSFKLAMILTNNRKKVSYCSMIIIGLSGACLWNFNSLLIEILIFGESIILLLDRFLKEENFKKKILYSVCLFIFVILYALTMSLSFMIGFAYVFLAMSIWIIVKNKKVCKINNKDFIILFLEIIMSTSIIVISYKYLGKNYLEENLRLLSTKKGNLNYIFSYLYNFILPYKEIENKKVLGNIISAFPIPMIMAFVYMYKNEKHTEFLLPMSVVAVLETIFCISGVPEIIANITMLKYVNAQNIAVVVSFINFYMLLYMLSNIEEEFVGIKSSIRISIAIMIIIIFIQLPTAISSKNYVTIFSCLLCLYVFLFLNNKDERYQKVLFAFMYIFTLIGMFANYI